MAIVKTDVPMTSALCTQALQTLSREYSLPLEVLTTTAYGRPVWKVTIGHGPRQVLYTAAHHANEWLTATVMLKFLEDLAVANGGDTLLAGFPARQVMAEATITMVPMVNPDGVDLVTGAIVPGSEEYAQAQTLAAGYPKVPFVDGWKANLLGVDLNLQYPAGWLRAREIKFSMGYTHPGPRDYVGRAPLTQRECQALAELTRQLDPALVLAYHSQGKEIYWQFGDIYVPGAERLGEEFARLSGYALSPVPPESSYAGFKDWFIQEFRRPGYTIEVGEGTNPLPLSQFDTIYRANLPILMRAAL